MATTYQLQLPEVTIIVTIKSIQTYEKYLFIICSITSLSYYKKNINDYDKLTDKLLISLVKL